MATSDEDTAVFDTNYGYIYFNETAEDFESDVERMDQWQWAELNGVEEKKAGMLLSVVGTNANRLLKDILTPETPKDKTIKRSNALLRHHSSKAKPLIIAERFKFFKKWKRGQKERESVPVADCVITLERLSATCDIGEFLRRALRDRLVCGLGDTQRRLLTIKKN